MKKFKVSGIFTEYIYAEIEEEAILAVAIVKIAENYLYVLNIQC